MIVGKEDLSKLLGNLADQKTAQKALKQACAYVEMKAKEKAPSQTGELKNSIMFQVNGLTGEVGTNLEYAVYVHQGLDYGLLEDKAEKRQKNTPSLGFIPQMVAIPSTPLTDKKQTHF